MVFKMLPCYEYFYVPWQWKRKEQREKPVARFQQLYMRHISPVRIAVVFANLILDYLVTAKLLPSVKTSKVRLIYGPCPTDAYYEYFYVITLWYF